MLTDTQQELYTSLIALATPQKAFFWKDIKLDNKIYRIFNYRLTSSADFSTPGALECRGVMFELNTELVPIRLASRPMHKFFNLDECSFTKNINLDEVIGIEHKIDGSLISTYEHNNTLRLKSKGHLLSDQSIDAMNWLSNNQEMYSNLLYVDSKLQYTINLEWCAPSNRIIINYPDARLTVLNARHRVTGEYASRQDLYNWFGIDNVIEEVNLSNLDIPNFIKSVPSMTNNIEGFVARTNTTWFKIKTNKYKMLHSQKSIIGTNRGIYEIILKEVVDDLLSLFADDEYTINQILTEQKRVNNEYNNLVHGVEAFFDANNKLDRKDYAMLGQQTLDTRYFPLAMLKYTGKKVDYVDYMLKNYQHFGCD